MPYYHVIVGLKSRPHKGAIGDNLLEQDLVNTIVKPYHKGEPFKCGDVVVSQDDISYMRITESEEILSRDTHWVSPRDYFANLWQAISQQKDVTEKFLKTLPQEKKEKIEETKPFSKNIFIVHGRDHKPVKELKAMLSEFGLNPIVLHEQASGSMTIAEKIERYLDDVGYAFTILTPDDVGCFKDSCSGLIRQCLPKRDESEDSKKEKWKFFFVQMQSMLRNRARQNVILEFGCCWGKLGRKKVCCLHKGDVDFPSDMQGIVYIPFKDSVNEARDMIMKELKEARYELKI